MTKENQESNTVTNLDLPVAVSPALVEIAREKQALSKKQKEEELALHEKFWDAVHAEYPLLSREANYSCSARYIDAGIVVLEEKQESKSEFKKILQQLID